MLINLLMILETATLSNYYHIMAVIAWIETEPESILTTVEDVSVFYQLINAIEKKQKINTRKEESIGRDIWHNLVSGIYSKTKVTFNQGNK